MCMGWLRSVRQNSAFRSKPYITLIDHKRGSFDEAIVFFSRRQSAKDRQKADGLVFTAAPVQMNPSFFTHSSDLPQTGISIYSILEGIFYVR